ncbi:hypothetical protein ACFQ08_04030 [Streptosporangium algeriense]|uniref:Uncharacterized protein n=1 Tax=Streptosporangium algeriense TaxID=1682748 RepID=A0ABW3DKK0_9ACTN
MHARSVPSSAPGEAQEETHPRSSRLRTARRFGVGLIAALGIVLTAGVPSANAVGPQNIDPELFVDISCDKTANSYKYKVWGVDFPRGGRVDADWKITELHSNGTVYLFSGDTSLYASSSGSWSTPTYGPESAGSGSGTAKIDVTVQYGLVSIDGSDTCTW